MGRVEGELGLRDAAFAARAMVFAAMLVLVWGLGAFQRGFFHDGVTYLEHAFFRIEFDKVGWFAPFGSPTRRLTLLPGFLAAWSPHPVYVLQALHGVLWLGQAILAGAIARRMCPNGRVARYLAVGLTLCATSDFLTNSLTAIHYNTAVTALLAAVVLALSAVQELRPWRLLLSLGLLQLSLWIMEVAVPTLVVLPALALAAVPREHWRWAGAWVASWWGSSLPFAVLFIGTLRDPGSYAATATQPMPPEIWLQQAWSQWLVNFQPWRWAEGRPAWFRPVGVAGEMQLGPLLVVLSAAVAVAFLMLVPREKAREGALEANTWEKRRIWALAVFALLSVAANTAYARIPLSEIWFRTHVVSRVWASLLIAGVLALLIRALPRVRFLPAAVAGLVVYFGMLGGLERQSYYQAMWNQHQRELASLLQAAPRLMPWTAVLLIAPDLPERFLATEVTYLASAWVSMLHGPKRTFVLSPEQLHECSPSEDALICVRDPLNSNSLQRQFPYDVLVAFEFTPEAEEWRVIHKLPAHLEGPVPGLYEPMDKVYPGPPSIRARRLLLLSASESGPEQ